MASFENLSVCILLVSSALVSGCATLDLDSAKQAFSSKTEAGEPLAEMKARADIAVATGRVAEENGDSGRAMSLYSEAITLNPLNVDAHWRQGIAFARLQQLDDANDAFEKAIALDSSNAALYADYGYQLYLQDRFSEAENALRKAIQLAPGDSRAHNNLGLVLSASGRQQEAIASYLEAGCSEADAQANLGFVQAMGNDLVQARLTFQTALELDPSLSNSSIALKQLNKVVSAGPPSGVAPVTYTIQD